MPSTCGGEVAEEATKEKEKRQHLQIISALRRARAFCFRPALTLWLSSDGAIPPWHNRSKSIYNTMPPTHVRCHPSGAKPPVDDRPSKPAKLFLCPKIQSSLVPYVEPKSRRKAEALSFELLQENSRSRGPPLNPLQDTTPIRTATRYARALVAAEPLPAWRPTLPCCPTREDPCPSAPL